MPLNFKHTIYCNLKNNLSLPAGINIYMYKISECEGDEHFMPQENFWTTVQGGVTQTETSNLAELRDQSSEGQGI